MHRMATAFPWQSTVGRRALPRRQGFTLLELLAICLVIGILATLAVTKYEAAKRRAYVSTMKADLHTVALSAETQFVNDNSYANVVLPNGSAGVTLTFEPKIDGYVATARHESVPGVTCTLTFGEAGTSSEPTCR